MSDLLKAILIVLESILFTKYIPSENNSLAVDKVSTIFPFVSNDCTNFFSGV